MGLELAGDIPILGSCTSSVITLIEWDRASSPNQVGRTTVRPDSRHSFLSWIVFGWVFVGRTAGVAFATSVRLVAGATSTGLPSARMDRSPKITFSEPLTGPTDHRR